MSGCEGVGIKKKSAARWDGNSGKIPPPLNKKKESKRVSFRLPKPATRKDHCDDLFVDGVIEFSEKAYQPRQYSPEQIYNAKSQYARFERAFELLPAKIEKTDKETVYWYPSCDAPDGFWKVRFGGSATFIRAKQIINMVCPAPYKVRGIASDGQSFVWEQISGNRTILILPPNVINPTLLLLSYCNGKGCDDGTTLPIVLKVTVAENPKLFDFITIYTTPTSNLFFGSYGATNSEVDCLKVQQIIPAPIYEYLAYQYRSATGSTSFTWNLPTCDNQYLIGFVLQQNINGVYVDIDYFELDEPRIFQGSSNSYYRLVAVYEYYGSVITSANSRPLRFTYKPEKGQKIVLADDTYRGLTYVSKLVEIQLIEPKAVRLEVGDFISELSYASAVQQIEVLDLLDSIISVTDQQPGITYGAATTSVVSLNLGGIIIK